jgi:hypothetical protein
MQYIYKYPLAPADRQTVELPKGARMLSVGDQGGSVFLWALVNPELPTTNRKIRCIGTGHPIAKIDPDIRFLGTVMLLGGSLVFHFFEEE